MVQILELLGKTGNLLKLASQMARRRSTLILIRRSMFSSIIDSVFMFQQCFHKSFKLPQNHHFSPIGTYTCNYSKDSEMHIKYSKKIYKSWVKVGKIQGISMLSRKWVVLCLGRLYELSVFTTFHGNIVNLL